MKVNITKGKSLHTYEVGFDYGNCGCAAGLFKLQCGEWVYSPAYQKDLTAEALALILEKLNELKAIKKISYCVICRGNCEWSE